MRKEPKIKTDHLHVVQTLLGGSAATTSAQIMRDRLIEVAGDRSKLVSLMNALGGLSGA